MGTPYRYLFGPVPSRRFGRSLGVDLIPFKTCTQDCIFCQLGRTLDRTILRREYVPTGEVLAELEAWLKAGGNADYITLSGSGEPTLHLHFGEVLDVIRRKTVIPGVLLTNGSLLHLPEVRAAAKQASIVKVSLSAWDTASYERVNRPHPDLTFLSLVDGQKAFRSEFQGLLWMEVFLTGFMNALPGDVRRIAAWAKAIAPDRIHLNTAVRPPAEDYVTTVSPERMEALAPLFEPRGEVIADVHPGWTGMVQVDVEAVLAMLRRRPCTVEQVAAAFDLNAAEAVKVLGLLKRSGRVRLARRDGEVFYLPTGRELRPSGGDRKEDRHVSQHPLSGGEGRTQGSHAERGPHGGRG